MSDLIIWGNLFSQPVRSVLAFCRLSDIEFTHRSLDYLAKEHLSEEYVQINPFQEMPAIVHNGFNIWESASEVTYLADAYNIDNSWYPKDIRIRARINSYLHWHHQNIREPLMTYLSAKIIKPRIFGGPELTEEQEIPYKQKLAQWYENLTWLLSETHYVARTTQMTIADVFVYNEIINALPMLDLNAHPEINLWFEEVSKIPVLQEYTEAADKIVKSMIKT